MEQARWDKKSVRVKEVVAKAKSRNEQGWRGGIRSYEEIGTKRVFKE